MNVYDVGDGIRLSANFTVQGTATTPTSVVLTVTDPSGNTSAPTPTANGTGAYYEDIILDEPGTWYHRWAGTGAVVAASEEAFQVRKRRADE